MGSNLKFDSTTRDYVPKTINQFLAHLSLIGDVSERLSKLDDYRKRLEEERTKIDPFKRELPLSLLLINDAIKTLKDEEMQYRRRNHQPVLEEFMPLKKTSEEEDGTIQQLIKDNSKDKKNWLSSAQLWKTDDHDDDSKNVDLVRSRRRNPSSQLFIKGGGGGGVKEELNNGSFKACSMVVSMGKTGKEEKVEEESTLSLVIPGMKNFKADESSFKINGGGGGGNKAGSSSTSSLQLQPNSRKQRRCWSPELHRQFVNALQQLGGSHVATPKQIRELMQVDGLTNDEVKSHLQKYRLHTRKASLTDENRSMILFMDQDQDQYSESSKQSSSQSASPHGPLDLAAAANGGGTSMEEEEEEEDEDDDKSESCGWKNRAYKSGKVEL